MAAVADQIEPAARDMIGDGDEMLIAAASIAISTKRQADALEKIAGALTSGEGLDGLHGTISNMAWEAGRSFQAGTRTDR
jgi:type 1 glutamine amidotransferase